MFLCGVFLFKNLYNTTGMYKTRKCSFFTGIKQRRYTISEIGHPCHFNRSRTDCAWCTPNAYQCGPDSKSGQYCMHIMKNHRHCRGESNVFSIPSIFYI